MTRIVAAAVRALLGGSMLLAGAGLVVDRAFPPDLSRLGAPATEVRDRAGRPLGYLPAPGGVWRFATSPGAVSPPLLRLLVATEDRRFWQHPGVDPWALARAASQWARSGRVVSGGSTLAMQAARLLQPRPRTVAAKLAEMLRAMQLERRYGRDGVLGIWLTLAPFGGNLEGVQAGALGWLGKSAAALEPDEAALLVALPRRPEALRPDRHPDAAARVRDRVFAVGVRSGLFAQAAILPPVPDRRVPFARHAAQVLAGLPRAPVVSTTLDLKLQTAVEELAASRLETLPARASLAILVTDARSREIRAACAGAPDGSARAGALDLTNAVRSPGSALKPFIYGMAFADGLATPDTVLADLPRRFGAYAPENYDRGFAGAVSAGEALQRSLNLPAVALLSRIGPLRFDATLRAAGVSLRLPPGADPSLPLALGGAGLTLRQLAGMYAALATDGVFRPLLLRPTDPPPTPPAEREGGREFPPSRSAGGVGGGPFLLPPQAAAQVAAVLTRPVAPSAPAAIAWKTGTSWGGRDAWAAGFDVRHVVAVWVGRPDGTPLPGATGSALALPLLARVFDLLPPAPRAERWTRRTAPSPMMAARRDGTDALRLLFPPPGAVLSADGPVTVRAMGGRRPLTFLVDGRPMPAEAARREASWTPEGPGSYSVTVLDATGAATHSDVRVR